MDYGLQEGRDTKRVYLEVFYSDWFPILCQNVLDFDSFAGGTIFSKKRCDQQSSHASFGFLSVTHLA